MKHLTLVAGLVASLAFPALSQPGGPIELRNPHRRATEGVAGSSPLGSGGQTGGIPGFSGGGGFGYVPGFQPTPPTPIVASPSAAMLADGPYLFSLRGDSLFQFDKKTLKLLNSAPLPHPTPTTGTSTISQPSSLTPPGNGYFGGNPVSITPTPPPSVAISADGPLLFIMRGNSLFQFNKKTLKLLHAADLPASVEITPATAMQDNVRTRTSLPLRPGPDFNTGPTF